jgi:polyhydroxyalkanoate synthase
MQRRTSTAGFSSVSPTSCGAHRAMHSLRSGSTRTNVPIRSFASGPFWRLRDYTKHEAAQSPLIVAAPIKRPYIWDLAPTARAIRYCLQQNLRVRRLEWLPASRTAGNNGLTEYTEAISNCVAKIAGESAGIKPFLIGHSLGGTLATLFGA